MHQEASDKLFWIIGLLVAAGVFAGIHIFTGQVATFSSPAVDTVPPVLAAEHTTPNSSVTPSDLALQVEPAQNVTMDAIAGTPPRTGPVIARIYECTIDGQRVFSDQVCAADARQRDISAPNRMTARETAIGYRAAAESTGTARSRAAAELSNGDVPQARCAALLRDKNYINSRMRAGYTNNEGEHLRARLRLIDSEYYDLRCRYFK